MMGVFDQLAARNMGTAEQAIRPRIEPRFSQEIPAQSVFEEAPITFASSPINDVAPVFNQHFHQIDDSNTTTNVFHQYSPQVPSPEKRGNITESDPTAAPDYGFLHIAQRLQELEQNLNRKAAPIHQPVAPMPETEDREIHLENSVSTANIPPAPISTAKHSPSTPNVTHNASINHHHDTRVDHHTTSTLQAIQNHTSHHHQSHHSHVAPAVHHHLKTIKNSVRIHNAELARPPAEIPAKLSNPVLSEKNKAPRAVQTFQNNLYQTLSVATPAPHRYPKESAPQVAVVPPKVSTPSPTIQVSIGQIRIQSKPPTPSPRSGRPQTVAPSRIVPLEQYLSGRTGGER